MDVPIPLVMLRTRHGYGKFGIEIALHLGGQPSLWLCLRESGATPGKR